MKEKTETGHITPFPFLAVLQAPDTFCPVDSCDVCMKVSGCQLLNNDFIQKYRYSQVQAPRL